MSEKDHKEKPSKAKSLRDNLRTSMQQKAYKQLIDVSLFNTLERLITFNLTNF